MDDDLRDCRLARGSYRWWTRPILRVRNRRTRPAAQEQQGERARTSYHAAPRAIGGRPIDLHAEIAASSEG